MDKKRRRYRFLPVCLFIELCLCVTAGGVQDNALFNLSETLTDMYGRGYARPVFNQSTVTYVHFTVTFNELIELNTKQEFVTIRAVLEMIWTDEYLRWNPSDFDDVLSITLPASRIWTPDITLLQNVDVDFVGLKPETVVIVESRGRVTWKFPGVFSSSCKQRLKYYPFDSQRCEFRFASFSFDHREMVLVSNQQYHNDSVISFLQNIEWESYDYSLNKDLWYHVSVEEPFSTLTYRVLLARRHTYHLLYLILPATLLSMVFPMVFYLPPVSKQKMTFAVTNLLAFVVFHQIVTGTIPFKSNDKPIFGIYLQIMIIIGCAVVAFTVVEIHVAFGDGPVSQWVTAFVFDKIARCACNSWLRKKYRRYSSPGRRIRRKHNSKCQDEIHTLMEIESSLVRAQANMVNMRHPVGIDDTTFVSQTDTKDMKDNNKEATGEEKNNQPLQMLFRSVASILDIYISQNTNVDAENNEREIRLNLCIVIDRCLFGVFSVAILFVTGGSILHLAYGSILEFTFLKNTI